MNFEGFNKTPKTTRTEKNFPVKEDLISKFFSKKNVEEEIAQEENFSTEESKENFSLPLRKIVKESEEVKEETIIKETRENLKNWTKEGEVRREEKEKKGDERCLFDYVKAIAGVKAPHFVDSSWQ